MRRFLAVLYFLLLTLTSVWGQNAAAQQEKKARLDREILILEQQLKDNSSKSSSALNRLSLIQQREKVRKTLIHESDKEIFALNDSIRRNKREADRVKARLDTMTTYYHRLVKNAYKNRDSRVWYMYILASENIGQASRRFGYLRSLSTQMNSQAAKIKEAKAELDLKLANLARLRKDAEKLRSLREAELGKLLREEAQSKKLVAQLNKEKGKYQKQLSSKRKQVEALNREIERLISESMTGSDGKKQSDRSKTSKPIDYTLAKEFQSNQGKLPWPADGPIADHFGRHAHPVYKTITMPFNNGINISVSKGTEAKAVFNGEVKRVIVMPGYSKCVLVQHGDYFTFYCKLASVSVKAGDKMKTGQTVGIVDTIDGQTQLHFQIWKGTAPQNPELWLRPRD